MDFIDDDRVPRRDQIVLEPAPSDPGGHDHHVPGRRFGRGLPLPVHHPIPERLLEQRLRDHPGRQRLPRPRAGHDPEALPRLGPRYQFRPVFAEQDRLDGGAQRQFDRLTRGPGRRDDDDPPARMPSGAIRGRIDRKVVVPYRLHQLTARPRPPFRFPPPGSAAAPPSRRPSGRVSPCRRTPPPSDRKSR